MTYKELAAAISQMDEEQQLSDITIYNSHIDEFFMARLVFADDEEDVLDPGHPYFTDMEFPQENGT